MRNGVLIEEATPQELLFKQNTNSLEAAFLSLIRKQKFEKVCCIIFHVHKKNYDINYYCFFC